jgi:translocation and assembly module TamB
MPAPVKRLSSPRNLWVHGKDINSEVGLGDGFRVEVKDEPMIFGELRVIRGRLEVFGRRFDFEQNSKVRFTGPMLRPVVEATAKHVNENEQVTVLLHVKGQSDSLSIKPESDPPLSETEIYTLLATGKRTLRPGSGNSSSGGAAASIIGSLAATQLKKTLASRLPLDVLSIEAGDSGLEGTKLEAGTYVGDKLYVGFTGRVGADQMKGENANAVNMEYQLGKRWSLDGEYGDAKAGGADLIWTKDY